MRRRERRRPVPGIALKGIEADIGAMAAVCDLPSVLVVEGGDATDALERGLPHFGHRVFTAADGDDALQALPDIDPDLVLLRRSPLRPVDPNVFDDGTLRVARGNPEVSSAASPSASRRSSCACWRRSPRIPAACCRPSSSVISSGARLIAETADNARLYVSYLRAKIEQDTAHPELIETVRGAAIAMRHPGPGRSRTSARRFEVCRSIR